MDRRQEDKILLENSIERVINTSINIASASSHEDAYINVEDWEHLKPLVVKLWNEARNRAFERSRARKERLVDQLTRDFSLSTSLFPLAWRINDSLKLTPDGGVEFTGSQNDVEDFREMLHRLDPNFSHGED